MTGDASELVTRLDRARNVIEGCRDQRMVPTMDRAREKHL
jgi:hypothetical protein